MVAQIGPAGAFGHVKGVIEGGVFSAFLGVRLAAALADLVGDHLLAFGVELVRGVLQEQHPEDVLLVRRASIEPRRTSAAEKRWRSS